MFNAPICATEVIINNDCSLDNLQNSRPTWIRTHVVRNFWHQVACLQMQATTSAWCLFFHSRMLMQVVMDIVDNV